MNFFQVTKQCGLCKYCTIFPCIHSAPPLWMENLLSMLRHWNQLRRGIIIIRHFYPSPLFGRLKPTEGRKKTRCFFLSAPTATHPMNWEYSAESKRPQMDCVDCVVSESSSEKRRKLKEKKSQPNTPPSWQANEVEKKTIAELNDGDTEEKRISLVSAPRKHRTHTRCKRIRRMQRTTSGTHGDGLFPTVSLHIWNSEIFWKSRGNSDGRVWRRERRRYIGLRSISRQRSHRLLLSNARVGHTFRSPFSIFLVAPRASAMSAISVEHT